MTSLVTLKPNDRGKIITIRGGRGVHSKLYSLGIQPGDIIKVVMVSPWGGPLYIHDETTGVNVAINRGIASKIMVEKLP